MSKENWKGKRFVPFTDEMLWKHNQAEGVYDNELNMKVIWFSSAKQREFDQLKARIAKRLNETVKEQKGVITSHFEEAQKIYEEITGEKYQL